MSALKSLSLQQAVERFLFDESEFLDRWQLADWEALFTDDGEYLVPPIGMSGAEHATPDTTLFLTADDREGLRARIERLSGKTAYCEMPRSNIRHMVSNVRILGREGDQLSVAANFCVYRIRRGEVTQYMGQYRYRLRCTAHSFRIRRKSVLLDIEVLRGQGALSFIL